MTFLTEKGQKEPSKRSEFFCDVCDFKTNNKSKFSRHCLTAKHNRLTDPDKKGTKSNNHTCSLCGKIYKSRMGLWEHSKNCLSLLPNVIDVVKEQNIQHVTIESIDDSLRRNPPIIDISLVMDLIQQNKELQNVLIQQSEKIIQLSEREPTNNIVNNTTNNNQKFNLNFFLNETCKDAMNQGTYGSPETPPLIMLI